MKLRKTCFYEWDMAYEVLVCMCWCTYLHIYHSVCVLYLYPVYHCDVMHWCLWFFFPVHWSFKPWCTWSRIKKLKERNVLIFINYSSITNTCTKEYKQVEKVHLKCKLCMVNSDMRLYMYNRIIDSAEFQAATFILLKPGGILSGFDFGKLFTMLLIMSYDW